MTLIPINVATEDELSEVMVSKLLAQSNRFAIGGRYRRGGFGYLRRTIEGWNKAARQMPYFVLTDLDHHSCPSALIRDWLRSVKHPNLLLRVAVKEVESWLLADRENFARFLGIREALIPEDPDEVMDPKALLVRLASGSRRSSLRDAIVPQRGSTAKQGPDYNACLSKFVTDSWQIDNAKENSRSLLAAILRLENFIPT